MGRGWGGGGVGVGGRVGCEWGRQWAAAAVVAAVVAATWTATTNNRVREVVLALALVLSVVLVLVGSSNFSASILTSHKESAAPEDPRWDSETWTFDIPASHQAFLIRRSAMGSCLHSVDRTKIATLVHDQDVGIWDFKPPTGA